MPALPEARLAVIGGSGFYQMDGIESVAEVRVPTPFGDPSDAIIIGRVDGVDVAFLPRHGRGHRVTPTEVNYRANIYALKTLGVERIVSISAVGSLREEIRPLDIVVPDQVIDLTKRRPSTFFGDGIVAHVGFAEPFCPDLSGVLHAAASECGATVHRGGTYVCMEGPQFSTRAESNLYRQWGASLIGMTACPEAKLAREAEICYGTLAMATDYDCWHISEEAVTVEMVVRNLNANVAMAKRVLRRAIALLGENRACGCESALATAIMTQRDLIPAAARKRLAPIIGRYI
jgi:5'-methylthioadenosine phosphorylase